LKTTTDIVSSNWLGFLKLTSKPPLPSLFSGFCLAAARSVPRRVKSSWLVMIEAPSSATLLAAPGASISRSISWVSLFYWPIWLRPSSRTEAACASFAALVGRSEISSPLSAGASAGFSAYF